MGASSGFSLAAEACKNLGPLDRSIVVTHIVLLAFCVARVGADVNEGPLGIEGATALTLATALVLLLVAKWIAPATRGGGPQIEASPGPSWDPVSVRTGRARVN